ncbi:hypothetical protein ACH5RR_039580 [Cinchona calisaya]|uniref:non-specific serine/threonine protein kinase n=1 Tax=Cinchona calisaya TaxID=153742 RepID=A0ABD2XYN7_9GENT
MKLIPQFHFKRMKIPHPTWSFWSSSTNVLLLVLVALNLPQNVSAERYVGNETDRIALLEFKNQISDPNGVLNSWNHSQNHCQWHGITCDARHRRITALNLPGTSLFGTISPHIGNLSFLKFIHLEENQFHGEIPQEVGRLFRLRFLNLSSNSLTGEIPINFSQCSELRVIGLIRNKLDGKIPSELGSLKKLEKLYLGANNLTGKIPSTVGNLTSINGLSFTFNNLEGNLPEEMSLLTNLIFLAMGSNMLTGQIPLSVYNISTLTFFTAPDNLLYGSLPTNLGLKLPNLQIIGIAGNRFSGKIPVSVTNCTKLEVIDLGDNRLEGQVPYDLGHLLNLQILSLQGNLLGGNSTGDLDFLVHLTNCTNLQILSLGKNNFGGELPNILGNLSFQLTHLYLSGNKISGTIPMGFERLVNLYIISLAENLFTGFIPSDFGKLQKLEVLFIGNNMFSGPVPSTLSNVSNLYALNLSSNNLHGDITRSLQNCQNLQMLSISRNNFSGIISPQIFGSYVSPTLLDLSHNLLSGLLPLEIGKLTNIQLLNVSGNIFSGEIPPTLGDCSSLEYIDMHNNFFNGTIPPTLASLKGIRYLDLSHNNFTGQIPRDINRLVFLKYLDLSYNDLEGEIPTDGVFGNASQIRLVGNSKLCGGIPELQLPSCLVKKKKKGKHMIIIILIPLVLVVTLVSVVLLLFYFVYQKRDKIRKESCNMPLELVEKILRISYHDLYRATEGFLSTNLIGSGSFGFVYKGKLDQHGDRLVAIKVLDLQKSGASKSFEAECRAMRNIRHRNLVSLLTYCSSIDPKGRDFKALVYELMQNGNLDMWLHPDPTAASRSGNLNLLQRLNIAIDVASALDYLHNYYEVAIVHCDLKPSNILLDDDLIAHVGDFGLARLLPNNASQQAATGSAITMKGSIGYAAPEYGMGLRASTQGDVYAYGILVLEMFIGKRPTDEMFKDGLDLHNYVKRALPEQVSMIVDPLLLPPEGYENEQMATQDQLNIDDEKKIECITSILRIGVNCSATSPNDRMPMSEIEDIVIIRSRNPMRWGQLVSQEERVPDLVPCDRLVVDCINNSIVQIELVSAYETSVIDQHKDTGLSSSGTKIKEQARNQKNRSSSVNQRHEEKTEGLSQKKQAINFSTIADTLAIATKVEVEF